MDSEFKSFVKVPPSPVILRSRNSSSACACMLPCVWLSSCFLNLCVVIGTLLMSSHLIMSVALALSSSYWWRNSVSSKTGAPNGWSLYLISSNRLYTCWRPWLCLCCQALLPNQESVNVLVMRVTIFLASVHWGLDKPLWECGGDLSSILYSKIDLLLCTKTG